MNLVSNIIINTYSILLLAVVFVHAVRHTEKTSFQDRLFLLILEITVFLLVLDSLSRFDGHPGTVYSSINFTGNFLTFLLSPVLPSLWLIYVHYQAFHDEKKALGLWRPLLIVVGANAVMLVLSQFHHWYYFIDADNVYHRGPLFWLPASIAAAIMLMAFALIVFNRSRIEKKHYFSLVFFAIPPFLSILLQVAFYGVSLMLNSTVLSLLIVFFNIQNRTMHIDYLTGVHNRKKLEAHMKERIGLSAGKMTFSAILIDMDDFKSINDTFGHAAGDDALETTARLLRSCLRTDDFIARFGGDEFYIILDTASPSDLKTAVERITSCFEEYNRSGAKPYRLAFSMGYDVYDADARMSADAFKKHIDKLMYKNKKSGRLPEPVDFK